MKFEDLYNRIYIGEQEEGEKSTDPSGGVPMPEDFDDVEPLPPAAAPEEGQVEGEEAPAAAPAASGSNLRDYVMQLEQFANKLQNLDGDSLQSLVSRLDRPGTPFDGISGRTKSEIIRAAETLRSIAIELTSFVINAAK